MGFLMSIFARIAVCVLLSAASLAHVLPANATTLKDAMARAYETNPEINAARAQVRSVDEGVTQAKSGYRPNVSAGADIGSSSTRNSFGSSNTEPYGYSVTVTQPLFRGFRTKNSVSSAEANVLSSRQTLANTEQNVLLSAVGAYMDVLSTRAIVNLRQRDVDALSEQLNGTTARFNVGEVTRTDVAQSQARLSLSQAQLTAAVADSMSAEAVFVQIVGSEPGQLARPNNIASLLPRSLQQALQLARENHPSILAAEFAVLSAEHNVKVIEGELLPSASIEGSYQSRWNSSNFSGQNETSSITARVNVPLYQGGVVYSRTRQAKEQMARQTLLTDIARRQVHASTVSAWEQLKAARQQIAATQKSVSAAQLALTGLNEEFRVGQRSTIDVLDARRDVLTAQISLVQAQSNEVYAAFSLLAAVGQLRIDSLQLPATQYAPEVHYQHVKNRWFGTDVPEYGFKKDD